MKQKQLSRKVVYDSHWVKLYVDRVECANGRIIEDFHVLKSQPASVVIIEDGKGNILFVNVFRYPTDSMQWELPAGRVEEGEPPIDTARREVREETGYEAEGMQEIFWYHPINGMSDKTFYVFRCRAGSKVGEPDPDEVQAVRWVPVVEVKKMIREKKIRDGLSLTALLYYFFG